jgi:hypothetical protein
MTKSASYEREARWFKKLNQPTSGVYRLSHAVRPNDAKQFEAEEVYKLIDASADDELAKHIQATSLLQPRKNAPTKKPKPSTARK